MNRSLQQTLAMAGICQAAFLVNQLAQHGLAAQDKLNTSLNSLFVTNPESTIAVYGSINKLRLGIQIMEEIFITKDDSLRTPELMRYLIGTVYLEARIRKQKDMLGKIAAGLQAAESEINNSEVQLAENSKAINQLAQLYQQTISTLSFRIQVTGKPQFLKNTDIANTIRATLLAGIRSAVLWQQLGGRRWYFLIKRRKISRNIRWLLTQLQSQ